MDAITAVMGAAARTLSSSGDGKSEALKHSAPVGVLDESHEYTLKAAAAGTAASGESGGGSAMMSFGSDAGSLCAPATPVASFLVPAAQRASVDSGGSGGGGVRRSSSGSGGINASDGAAASLGGTRLSNGGGGGGSGSSGGGAGRLSLAAAYHRALSASATRVLSGAAAPPAQPLPPTAALGALALPPAPTPPLPLPLPHQQLRLPPRQRRASSVLNAFFLDGSGQWSAGPLGSGAYDDACCAGGQRSPSWAAASPLGSAPSTASLWAAAAAAAGPAAAAAAPGLTCAPLLHPGTAAAAALANAAAAAAAAAAAPHEADPKFWAGAGAATGDCCCGNIGVGAADAVAAFCGAAAPPPQPQLHQPRARPGRAAGRTGPSALPLAVPLDVVDFRSLALGRCVGRGAEGAVYEARLRDAPVAVKEGVGIDELAAHCAAGAHDNVVGLRGVAQKDDGTICLVLEFCARGTLDALLHGDGGDGGGGGALRRSAGGGNNARPGSSSGGGGGGSGAATGVHRPPPLELSRALPLLRGVARGLAHLHARRPPLLHRDLKPQNVFIGHGGVPKIGDFGMSRTLVPPTAAAGAQQQRARERSGSGAGSGSGSGAATAARGRSSGGGGGGSGSGSIARGASGSGAVGGFALRTLTPGVVGTVAYSAPEVLDEARQPPGGARPDRLLKADVYSLGVLVWEVIERRRPFGGADAMVLAATWLTEPSAMALPPLSARKGAGPAERACLALLHELVQDCTAADPDARPTADGALDRLRRAHRLLANGGGSGGFGGGSGGDGAAAAVAATAIGGSDGDGGNAKVEVCSV